MDKFISNQENTNLALNVYEEEILKGNWIVLDNLENMIKNSNWELQYNLLRIRERFDEMKNIFEKEVFPIIEEADEIAVDEWFWKKKEFLGKQAISSELNELTISIIKQFKIKE